VMAGLDAAILCRLRQITGSSPVMTILQIARMNPGSGFRRNDDERVTPDLTYFRHPGARRGPALVVAK
jgi:hypothetical protein